MLTSFLRFVELGEALYTHEARMLELISKECHPLLFQKLRQEGILVLAEGAIEIDVGQVGGSRIALVAIFALVDVLFEGLHCVMVRSIPC